MSTNYFDKDVSAELIQEMIGALRANDVKYQEEFFDTIDDYYENRTAEESRCAVYFKKFAGETSDEYNDRVKLAAPWAKIFVDSIVNWFYTGKTKYEWVQKDAATEADASDELTEKANKIQQAFFEFNQYHKNKHVMLKNAIKYGSTLGKLRFLKYDNSTGKPLVFDDVDGQGLAKLSEIPAFFYVPIYNDKDHDLVQAVVICYDFDAGGGASEIAKNNVPGSDKYTRVLEFISQSVFDGNTGKEVYKGQWQAFKVLSDGTVKPFDETKEGEQPSTENKYKIMPCVIWENWEGKSMVYDSISLFDRYNKVLSAFANCLSALGYPIVQFTGMEPGSGKSLLRGPNRIWYTGDPEGKAKFESIATDFDVQAFTAMMERLERFMSFAWQVPLEVINGIQESKSGVQLKMLFTALVHLRENLQKTIGHAEERTMYTAMYMREIENGDTGHSITENLKPVVTYEPNIIPADEAEQLTNDIIKLDKGAITLEDFIMKYNPKVDTLEKAKELADKKRSAANVQVQADKEDLKKELFGGEKAAKDEAPAQGEKQEVEEL